MNILLLNPSPTDSKLITDATVSREVGISSFDYIYPPLGLMYVASILKKNGHECTILDGNTANLDLDALKREFDVSDFDIVFIQMPPSLIEKYSRIVKDLKKSRKARIVYLGPFPTTMPDMCLKAGADFVIRGEPEHTALEFVESVMEGRPLDSVKGLSYMERNRVKSNPARDLIRDLDSLPFPDRSLIDNSKYFIPFSNEPFTTIITSRGCPHRCIFCPTRIYFGNVVRPRSIENVIQEVKECVQKYSLKHICFWDDTFNFSMARAKNLCRAIIRENLGIKWFCLSRVDKVDFELLSLMKRSGCYNIQFGVESASQSVLDAIKKDITVEQIERAFRMSKDIGISTTGFFMFGNLGESPATIRETIRFAKRINPDYARFCLATPFPGTEFFDIIKDRFKQDWTKSDILHSMEMDHVYHQNLDFAINYAYRSFYFRPSFLAKELLRIRSLRGLNYKLKQAVWLFRNMV